MGAINDVFIQNKLSLSLKTFDEIVNFLINKSPNKIQNKKILKEIGLINEYIIIRSDKEPNLIVYYSQNHKIIQNLKFLIKMRSNFLGWVKCFFDITKEDLDSNDKLNNKIEQIKQKDLTKEYFQNNLKKNLFFSKNINVLINSGFPSDLRLFIWNVIISLKYNKNKIFNQEEESKIYRNLLTKIKQNPQIEKDIHRTFIKDEEKTPNNLQILKNVLNCINSYNQSGYCQGMNYIVAFLLKISNYDEVITFYFFKNILDDIKGYFEEGLPLLNKNIKIFEVYFCEFYPKIYKHFKKHEIINEFYITKWLQTLLTLSLPFEELSIIWDALLIRGFDFIIFICLAFFDFIEDNILKLKESADIIHYMEKTMNSKDENLIPVNIKFFEQIDEYIIPINEVLEKAQEIERKINNKKKIYESKKSDNQILNMKNSINEIKNNINENHNLINSTKLNTSLNLGNKPKIPISSFSVKNNFDINNMQQIKPNYYSTKNLGNFNFNINSDVYSFQVQNQNLNQINTNVNNLQNYNNNNIYNRVNYSTKFLSYNP